MQNQLLLHIPHSSDNIPSFDSYLVDKKIIQNEIVKLTDWYTDEIFSNSKDIAVVAPVSRVFCDMERFVEDELEPMSKKGMGVLYTHTDDGMLMREVTEVYKNDILEEYYFPHHQSLSSLVKKQLEENGRSLIIDCHSFADIPFIREVDQDVDRPDICIGSDAFHTPEDLIEKVIATCKRMGYTTKVNSPYSGSLVPMEYYQSQKNVSSLMIEINRRVYLESDGCSKSQGFGKVKEDMQDLLDFIRAGLPSKQAAW